MKACSGMRKEKRKEGEKEKGVKGDANVRNGNKLNEKERGRCRKFRLKSSRYNAATGGKSRNN